MGTSSDGNQTYKRGSQYISFGNIKDIPMVKPFKWQRVDEGLGGRNEAKKDELILEPKRGLVFPNGIFRPCLFLFGVGVSFISMKPCLGHLSLIDKEGRRRVYRAAGETWKARQETEGRACPKNTIKWGYDKLNYPTTITAINNEEDRIEEKCSGMKSCSDQKSQNLNSLRAFIFKKPEQEVTARTDHINPQSDSKKITHHDIADSLTEEVRRFFLPSNLLHLPFLVDGNIRKEGRSAVLETKIIILKEEERVRNKDNIALAVIYFRITRLIRPPSIVYENNEQTNSELEDFHSNAGTIIRENKRTKKRFNFKMITTRRISKLYLCLNNLQLAGKVTKIKGKQVASNRGYLSANRDSSSKNQHSKRRRTTEPSTAKADRERKKSKIIGRIKKLSFGDPIENFVNNNKFSLLGEHNEDKELTHNTKKAKTNMEAMSTCQERKANLNHNSNRRKKMKEVSGKVKIIGGKIIKVEKKTII